MTSTEPPTSSPYVLLMLQAFSTNSFIYTPLAVLLLQYHNTKTTPLNPPTHKSIFKSIQAETTKMSSNPSNTQQPGLVAAHAEYIKGAAEVLPPSLFCPPSPLSYTAANTTLLPTGSNRLRDRLARLDLLGRTRQSPRPVLDAGGGREPGPGSRRLRQG